MYENRGRGQGQKRGDDEEAATTWWEQMVVWAREVAVTVECGAQVGYVLRHSRQDLIIDGRKFSREIARLLV